MPPFPYHKNKFQPNYFLPLISVTMPIFVLGLIMRCLSFFFFFFFLVALLVKGDPHGSRKYKSYVCVYFPSDEGAKYGFAFNLEHSFSLNSLLFISQPADRNS